MSKRLSRRPLKRTVRFEIMLGPYSTLNRDGKERPREHFVIWTAELPRFIAVLQKMNRPDAHWDRIHNPVLFQKIVLLTAGTMPIRRLKPRCIRPRPACTGSCKSASKQSAGP